MSVPIGSGIEHSGAVVITDRNHGARMQPFAEHPTTTQVEVCVLGALDTHAVPRISAALTQGVAHRPATLVVDLASCEFIDAAGIGLLIDVHRRLRRAGGRLTLRGLSPKLSRTLRLARVDHVLDIATDGSLRP